MKPQEQEETVSSLLDAWRGNPGGIAEVMRQALLEPNPSPAKRPCHAVTVFRDGQVGLLYPDGTFVAKGPATPRR